MLATITDNMKTDQISPATFSSPVLPGLFICFKVLVFVFKSQIISNRCKSLEKSIMNPYELQQ